MRRGHLGGGHLSPGGVLLYSAALLAALVVVADARQGDVPLSFVEPVTEISALETAVMPAVDVEAYLQEDEDRIAAGIDGPFRIAAPHYVMIDVTGEATLDVLPNGARIWRLRVVSEGAKTLNFGFTTFDLGAGSTIHLFPAEEPLRDLYWDGPYMASDAVENEFWSPAIPGDDVVIEVFAPALATEPRLIIAQVNHDYRGFFNIDKDGQLAPCTGTCNNDVICPEADPWSDEIRSAGVYILNGFWTCSGQMMNSLTDPKAPYFLTARHCGVTSGNDHTMRVYWKKESPNCGDLCCGPLSYNQLGTTWRAGYSPSDFTLVEMSAEPSPNFEVYYAGWDADEDWIPQECTAIHHPQTCTKTISFNDDPLLVSSYFGPSPGDGTHWRVLNWEDGTTEPGSSGSGIWDENRRVVGQLHGGQASCSNNINDYYGRLSRSFVGGGTSTTRLKDWFDPDDTGTLALDGFDPQSTSVGDVAAGPHVGGLHPISPNPATAGVRIGFDLAATGRVGIEILDVSGRVVRSLTDQTFDAGSSRLSWDGRADGDGELGAGVYFVRMRVDGRPVDTEKMIFIR